MLRYSIDRLFTMSFMTSSNHTNCQSDCFTTIFQHIHAWKFTAVTIMTRQALMLGWCCLWSNKQTSYMPRECQQRIHDAHYHIWLFVGSIEQLIIFILRYSLIENTFLFLVSRWLAFYEDEVITYDPFLFHFIVLSGIFIIVITLVGKRTSKRTKIWIA